MIKAGSPEDLDRMMARLDADKVRPMDDTSMIRDFPKCGRPWYRSAVFTARRLPGYGLIEWLDASGKYHLGWAQSASIKRVTAEEWKGSSGL